MTTEAWIKTAIHLDHKGYVGAVERDPSVTYRVL